MKQIPISIKPSTATYQLREVSHLQRSNRYVSDHGIKWGLWLVAIKIKHNSDPQKIYPNRHNDSILKAHWLTRSSGHGAPGNELRNMEGNSALENSWCHTIFWLPTDIVNLSKGFKYKIKLKAWFLFSLWHIVWVMIAKMKHCSFWTLSW